MPVFSRANKFGEPFTPYLNGGEFIDVNTVRNTLSEITKVFEFSNQHGLFFISRKELLSTACFSSDRFCNPARALLHL